MNRISVRQVVTYLVALGVLLLARPMWPTYIAGCVLALLGIGIRVWGCGHLRKNKQLITSGPYAHVQHPLYFGTFLVALGAIIAAGSPKMPGIVIWAGIGPLFLIAFFSYYMPKKMRVEGARLAERFPNEYPAFAQTVPAFMPALRGYPQATRQPWSGEMFRANHELGMDIVIAVIFGLMLLVPRFITWP